MRAAGTITGINIGSERFHRLFRKLPIEVQKTAAITIASIVGLDVSLAPAKLHLHPLTNVVVDSFLPPPSKIKVYTIHITPDDRYKASFTWEAGTAYFRVCGEHDWVDSSP